LGFEDEADYIKPWPQERIVLMVDQEGIRFFHWEYPVIITNKLESNMKPLSFEAVWQHAKDLLILGSSWVADATTVEYRHVTRIMLTNCMVRSTKEMLKLPVKQMRRIYAHFFLRLSETEIARAERVSIAAVSASIAQGLRHLRQYLSKE